MQEKNPAKFAGSLCNQYTKTIEKMKNRTENNAVAKNTGWYDA
jgi:hypothetical protein